MIKENVSKILKPIAEKAMALTDISQSDIQLLEISAMIELEMDTSFGTDGKLFIKIYPDQTIEIRHRTNDGTVIISLTSVSARRCTRASLYPLRCSSTWLQITIGEDLTGKLERSKMSDLEKNKGRVGLLPQFHVS